MVAIIVDGIQYYSINSLEEEEVENALDSLWMYIYHLQIM